MSDHAEPGFRTYILVWIALIAIVAVEVVLTYSGLSIHQRLAALLALAFVEAAIGLMYFMHLRHERRLFWALIPGLLFVLIMMDHLWPDALRLFSHRLPLP
jgi:heme/copper-type cytochrome/quinol oxidase subunit 4